MQPFFCRLRLPPPDTARKKALTFHLPVLALLRYLIIMPITDFLIINPKTLAERGKFF